MYSIYLFLSYLPRSRILHEFRRVRIIFFYPRRVTGYRVIINNIILYYVRERYDSALYVLGTAIYRYLLLLPDGLRYCYNILCGHYPVLFSYNIIMFKNLCSNIMNRMARKISLISNIIHCLGSTNECDNYYIVAH